jgi:putative flippase GtrA
LNFTTTPRTDRPPAKTGTLVLTNDPPSADELSPEERPESATGNVPRDSVHPKARTAPVSGGVPHACAVSSTDAREHRPFRRFFDLAFGRMSRFAVVGASGAVLNLVIMSALLGAGMHYLAAAVLATELTILSNFLMHEWLVFRDARQGRPFWQRLLASFGFNNLETLLRMPVLVLLVDLLFVPSLLAQAATLAVAFLIRFTFTSRVIYRIHPVPSRPALSSPLQEVQQS